MAEPYRHIPNLYRNVLRRYAASNALLTKKDRVRAKVSLIESMFPESYRGQKNPTESFYDGIATHFMAAIATGRPNQDPSSAIARLKRQYSVAKRSESTVAARNAKVFNLVNDEHSINEKVALIQTLYEEPARTVVRESGLVINEYPVALGTSVPDAARAAILKGGSKAKVLLETNEGQQWLPATEVLHGYIPDTGGITTSSDNEFTDVSVSSISTASYGTTGSCEEKLKQAIRTTRGGLVLLRLPCKKDECLTAIFRNAAHDEGHYCKTIGTSLGLSMGPKGPEDFVKLCAHYNIYARVFAEGDNEHPIATYGKPEGNTVDLLHKDNHFTRILAGTSEAGALQHIQAEQARRDFEFILNEDEITRDPGTNDFGPLVKMVVESTQDIYISGPGGVGKSFLLRQISYALRVQCFMTASTGVAAVRIGGMTIHSLCAGLEKNPKLKFAHPGSVVIIDECSMLSSTTMGEFIAKLKRRKFRLIIAADEAQLPPVDRDDSNGYFFQCDEFLDFKRIVLSKVRRTEDVAFAKISLKIRLGIFDDEVRRFIRSVPRISADEISSSLAPGSLYITNFNKTADDFNARELAKNKNPVRSYPPIFNCAAGSAPAFLVERCAKRGRFVSLKEGCRVVITKNHRMSTTDGAPSNQEHLYNGMIGTVLGFGSTGPIVKMDINKRNYEIGYISNTRHGEHTKSGVKKIEVHYLPVKLAYALTVHKAQGSTVSGNLIFNLDFYNQATPSERLSMFYTGISRLTDSRNLRFVEYDKFLDELGELPEMHLDKIVALWLQGRTVPTQSEITACFSLGEVPDYSIIAGNEMLEPIVPKKILTARPERIIYYDFETALTMNGATIAPYLCSMQGEIAVGDNPDGTIAYASDDKIPAIISDIPGLPNSVFAQSVVDEVLNVIKRVCNEFEGKALGELRKVSDSKKRGKKFNVIRKGITRRCPRLCAYNGSKFDLFFLMTKILSSSEWFPKDRYVLTMVLKSNCIISLSLVNKHFGFPVLISHDLCQVSPMTLAEACVSFLPGEPAKIDFHDQIMTLSNIRYKELDGKDWSVWREPRDYVIKSFPPTMMKGDPHRFLTERTARFVPADAIEYCLRDTDVLKRLYHAEDKTIKLLGDGAESPTDTPGVFDFLTCGSLTWYYSIKGASTMCAKDDLSTRKIYSVNAPMNDFIRKSIYGGRACPRITYRAAGGEPYVYLDIAAMYGSIMTKYKFPYGRPEWIVDKTQREKQVNEMIEYGRTHTLAEIYASVSPPKFFFARITFEERSNSLEPVIPEKTDLGTRYILGKREAIITSLDIAMIVSKGGRILDVGELLTFGYSDFLCRPWVTKCVEDKKKYGKAPRGTAAKLLGNCAYGQLLRKDHINQWSICTKPEETEEFLKRYVWDSYLSVGAVDILYGHKKDARQRFLSTRAPYIGSFVLAYARLALQFIVQTVNPTEDPALQPALGDTDSLLVPISSLGRLIDAGIVPKPGDPVNPGQMADEIADTILLKSPYIPASEKKAYEGKFWTISKWFSPAPKVLAVEIVDPVKDDLYYKFRTKGISVNSQHTNPGGARELCSAATLFDSMETHLTLERAYMEGKPCECEGDSYDLGETLSKIGPGKIKVNERLNAEASLFTIEASHMERRILTKIWEGRHHIGNGITVPHGWAPLAPK